MNKNCKKCNKEFEVTEDDLEFLDKVSPEIGAKKYNIPAPTLCFECRLQRRLTHRNERFLYSRKCDAPGHDEMLVSMYDSSPHNKVYCQKYWWSDEWDATDFGMDYDPARSFFEQFGELQLKVPRIALINSKAENSEFCNYTFGCKNCYMEVGGVESDFVLFSYNSVKDRDCADCLMTADSENCYELMDSSNCYEVKYGRFNENCRECSFIYDCKSCSNCIGCIGLRNKQYHIFNKPYSKEEYEQKAKEYDVSSFEKMKKLKKEAEEFFVTFPHEYARLKNCENVIGNSVENSKDSIAVFDILASSDYPVGTENCKFCVMAGIGLRHCHDMYQHGGDTEYCYEICGGMHLQKTHFCLRPLDSSNLLYCENCENCQDCFGCTGLNRKQYCILNKQYTKEEYEKKIDEIISDMQKSGEWGEFFDPNISLFGYNESNVMDYFPLSKNEALTTGYQWKEKSKKIHQVTKEFSELPENISEADSSILQEVVSCECADNTQEELERRNCSKAFKILPQELELYRKIKVSLPRRCPNCRFYGRLHSRDGIKLYHRKCMNEGCQNEFETPYSSERPEKIYCKSCYQKEVI